MHELSIAINIVEIAEEYAKRNSAESISEINIEVGLVSGVVIDALEFAMDSAKKNSMLENAEINIIEIPANAKCISCGCEFKIKDIYEICPECQSFNPEIISGKELKVQSIIIN